MSETPTGRRGSPSAPAASSDDAGLVADLRRWAEGDRGAMAAVVLLVTHGHWLRHLAENGYVERYEGGAAPLLRKVLTEIEDGTDALDWAHSSSELAILRIAASLAGKWKVNLQDELCRLDRGNLALVTRVFGAF